MEILRELGWVTGFLLDEVMKPRHSKSPAPWSPIRVDFDKSGKAFMHIEEARRLDDLIMQTGVVKPDQALELADSFLRFTEIRERERRGRQKFLMGTAGVALGVIGGLALARRRNI